MTVVQPTRHAAEPTLREPAHRVNPRALKYWVITDAIWSFVVGVGLVVGYQFLPDSWARWLGPLFILIMLYNVVTLALEPLIRYRRTRWEVTGERVFSQTGWLSRDQRIAPLSRVQTVDTQRGPVMRLFRLANITVTTASAAGPITLTCLDTDLADQVTADLARVTGQTRGDAT
ncbi:PH domain-containing protein [Serinicoccus kebangsaanensis]|uniref:PH domain-containing protein n=1 Tax=Serinicoccus kebangsaanensis TaxID=2602069 RepID=UPI00124C84ED|nr:PH domain-containing protein [Serinicoccus kebangsaanensis]